MHLRILPLLVAASLTLGLASHAGANPPAADRALREVLSMPMPADGLSIGVVLRGDDLPWHGPSRLAPLRARQQRVLQTLPAGFQLSRRYEALSGFSGWADREAIEALQAHPEVEFIYLNPKLRFSLIHGVPLIGATAVHSLGYTGEGVNVAVIDTGIDTNHPDLMDDLVVEQCFCDNHPNPNRGCCPSGDDEQSGAGAAEDVVGHGTQVTGVITSAGNAAALGVAPAAGIVAIRIADEVSGPAFSDAERAIDWVIVNRAMYDIEVINMSFGDGGEFNSAAACAGTNFANAIKDAHDLGIAIFVASGNDGHDDGISFPACVPEAISVGGSYDAAVGAVQWCTNLSCSTTCTDTNTVPDMFVCHANSDELLDLVAPDWKTTTSNRGGGALSVGGTSLSSPYAAGQAALLREADPSVTPAQILMLMQSHGPMVTNPDNGLSFRRTDVALALISLIGSDADSDGIFDDGDASGTAGDTPCVGGASVACDDNCLSIPNADQADGDADGVGDVCDSCPGFDDGLDFDGDGMPDGCDPDDDGDGLLDVVETDTGSYVSPADTGSDPLDPDSDDDGFLDGFEVAKGSDPNDGQSLPVLNLPSLSPGAMGLLVAAICALAAAILIRRGREPAALLRPPPPQA